MNNRTFEEWWPWLVAPAVLAILVYGFLFLYASPGLRLEGGRAGKMWRSVGRLIGVSSLAILLVTLCPSPLLSQEGVEQQPDAH